MRGGYDIACSIIGAGFRQLDTHTAAGFAGFRHAVAGQRIVGKGRPTVFCRLVHPIAPGLLLNGDKVADPPHAGAGIRRIVAQGQRRVLQCVLVVDRHHFGFTDIAIEVQVAVAGRGRRQQAPRCTLKGIALFDLCVHVGVDHVGRRRGLRAVVRRYPAQ